MKIVKPRFWRKKNSFFGLLLLPLSGIIQILLKLKSLLTQEKKFQYPVICVGNIYIGGTGKTPLSIEIYKLLESLNYKPAIIKKEYSDQFDEISLIKSYQCKIFTGKKRKDIIDEAIEGGRDSLVLDDGYQDHSVLKNLSILCFNSDQLIGNGLSIPSGPLREPLSSLNRSKIVVVNGNKNEDFELLIKKISSKIEIFYSKYIPVNLNNFLKKNLLAFAGIGNPENFFKLLEKNGCNVVRKIFFPDHYPYKKKELEEVIEIAKKDNLEVITTEKDYHRIEKMGLGSFKFLKLKLEIENKKKFDKLLKEYI